jgi:GNAT superfamily N-acetyltransferase
MEHHIAVENDLDLLAEWNHQLIQDEGHRNPMTVSQLRERMREWISGEYNAIVFSKIGEPVAYALFRENEKEIYLRQLFVRRDKRNKGLGKEAVMLLQKEIWPKSKRLTVEVLSGNKMGINFWHSVGYKDYCLTLEIMPET